MSENLGSVYYTVDAKTTSMLEAEALINKSIAGVVKDFSVADKAVSAFVKKQEELGRTVNKSGQVFNANGKIVVSASNDYRALASAANMAKDKAMQMNAGMSKTAQGVSAGMRGMQSAAQNFGYQIQDIAVQLAGGQNFILILAQQLPQMLTGMGAAAAGIGALIAVVGGLSLAFGTSVKKIELFDKAIESIQASITLAAGGVSEYTEQMKVLAGLSETMAKIKIASLIGEQKQAYKDGSSALQEYTQNVFGFVRGFGSFEEKVSKITGKKLGKEGFDEAANAVKEFRFQVTSFSLQQTEDSVDSLESSLKRLAASGATSTAEGRALIETTLAQITAFRSGQITLEALNKSLNDNSLITKGNQETVKSLVDSLKLESETLGATARAQALHIAWLNKATQAQLSAINSYFDVIEAQEKKIEADEKAKDKEKENAKSIKDVSTSLEDQRAQLTMTADGYEQYALRKKLAAAGASEAVINANLAELKSLQALRAETALMEQVDADTQTQKLKVQTDYEQTGQQITSELETPAQKAERELAERLEVIRTYNALETAEDAKKTEMGMLALDAYAAKMQEINAKTMESNFASTLADSFVGLQNQISGTMAQVALGFKDGDDAAKSLATTILTELVGAMINYGIKQAWAYTFGAAASTAAAATQTTAAIAATTAATTVSLASAAAIAAAWATPAALVSAATFGASAVAGTAALAAAVASSGAMALASQSLNAGIGAAGAIAGGKLYGGSVQSGTMYPVNENGAPELFQSGNKQYLMPNSRGEVISNKDATSSGSSSGETMVNFTYSPSIQALDSDGVATILAEQQETLWNLVQRAANERGRKL